VILSRRSPGAEPVCKKFAKNRILRSNPIDDGMKVTHVHIENFKRFAPPGLSVPLIHPGTERISDQFLILGDNGSGKTTILQAVALTLSLATRQTRTVHDLRWVGWAGDRYYAKGESPVVEVSVQFSPEEIEATREINKRWWKLFGKLSSKYIEPGDAEKLTLRLRGPDVEVVGGNAANLLQFQGRINAAALTNRGDMQAREYFPQLPGLFWFDQFRNISVIGDVPLTDEQPQKSWERNSFQLGLSRLSEYLRVWHRTREKGGSGTPQDLLGQLDDLYGQIFPGRRFAGFEPVYGDSPTPVEDRPVLSDGVNLYDLREMSAGEQAIFPLIFEFVRLQIHRSVILIDELDLNLHPPLAQRLLGLLPRLGEDNQFLFTTHASAVSSMVSPRDTFRLPGGHLCL